MKNKHFLSKSLYTRGLQCEKSLWLKKNNPDVLTQPDEAQKVIFATGDKVGEEACKLFPGGEKIEFEGTTFKEKIQKTRELISSGCGIIYEASFSHNNIFVMVDILRKSENGWEIYEVKSSTAVKDVHIHDVAVQKYVLEGCELNITKTAVVHLNNQYVRGENLDIQQLFTIAEIDSLDYEHFENIDENLILFNEALDHHDEPDIQIGQHCLKPYECDCKNYCWAIQNKIPDYSVFNISGLNAKKKFDLYHSGIININDVPSDYPLSQKQRAQVDGELANIEVIDRAEISQFLNELHYPIYHLDFETYQDAIPQFTGQRPYQQIPFQYSIHVEQENGYIDHFAYLAESGEDPRRKVAEALVKDILMDVQVLAYNASFERSIVQKLAEQFMDLYEHLMNISENIVDLMIPFQKQHYYTTAMKGSYSIKSVMPALVPEMDNAYKGLELVSHGADAMNIFPKLSTMTDQDEIERNRKALLDYCELDTLAMVKVLHALKNLLKE